ncbi:MAG: 23S rRNA (guanosine(2251)-2'-O)-methyltransferase RlmB [Bacilli bacterium]|nr:23S rRNA (guanosine(2251)-2'-O)-methyltransferase RlmB [Bacilli bacterium]
MIKKNDNLIFGRNPVKEALRSDRVLKVYLERGFSDRSVLDIIENKHIPVIYVDRKELDSVCDGVHQGLAADTKGYSYCSIEEILSKAKKETRPIVVLLDGINDPHNLGAILRSCDVFGVTGLIMAKHNQVMLNATVAKTSAGAINYVPVAVVSNLNNAIRELKEHGFWIVSSDGSGNTNYQEVKYDFPTALVVGSEGKGVSQLVLKNSDFIVKIPMHGKVNSLNASVATGIFLAQIKGSL